MGVGGLSIPSVGDGGREVSGQPARSTYRLVWLMARCSRIRPTGAARAGRKHLGAEGRKQEPGDQQNDEGGEPHRNRPPPVGNSGSTGRDQAQQRPTIESAGETEHKNSHILEKRGRHCGPKHTRSRTGTSRRGQRDPRRVHVTDGREDPRGPVHARACGRKPSETRRCRETQCNETNTIGVVDPS